MSLEAVQSLEEELGYGPDDKQVLKGIRLVWQRLEKLRQQAVRDDRQLNPYRDLLRKSITQARAQQPLDDPEAAATAFWAWYAEKCRELGIAEREYLRGKVDHQAWCEKWLPEDYRRFATAVAITVNEPSLQHFDELRTAAERMLKAYVGAVGT